jgi:hypothetical protein
MKQLPRQRKYKAFALLIIICGFGVYVAQIASQYEIIVRGILGMVIPCLILFYSASVKTDKTLDIVLVFPDNIPYLVLGFILAFISYWSADQIYIMILYLIYK